MAGEAQRIVNVIGAMVQKNTSNGARIQYTPGVIHDGSGAYESSAYVWVDDFLEGIIVPAGEYVANGDYVVLGISDEGKAWIDRVLPTSLYARMVTDYNRGRVGFGDGTEAPEDFGISGQVFTSGGSGASAYWSAVTSVAAAIQHNLLLGLTTGDDHPQYTLDTTFDDHSARHESAGADVILLDNLGTPDDNTDLNATTGHHGLLPKLHGSSAYYLDGSGAFSQPSAYTASAGDLSQIDYADTAAVGASAYAAPLGHQHAVNSKFQQAQIAVVFDGHIVNDYVDILVPFDLTVVSWTLMADVSGTCTVDLWMDTYGNFPPTNADSITSSATPAITGPSTKGQSSTLTGWDTTWVKGDTVRVVIEALSTITQLTLALEVTKT